MNDGGLTGYLCKEISKNELLIKNVIDMFSQNPRLLQFLFKYWQQAVSIKLFIVKIIFVN